MNRDEKQKRLAATEPPRPPTEPRKRLRIEPLETRVTPNAIWGD